MVESDGAEPEAYVEDDMARTGKGRMPGVAATESAVTTAIVEEIKGMLDQHPDREVLRSYYVVSGDPADAVELPCGG